MAATRSDQAADDGDVTSILSIASETSAQFPAWEQIETGRFMPRRVRGSFRGGVLG
jgi:hypothetical protein